MPLYLEDQASKERPYLVLVVRGCGVFPRLDFSTQSVALQTVPLGIRSRALFYIMNNGYDDLKLSHRPAGQSPVPINVSFPDGNMLGLTMAKIPVEVSFRSDAAVSFKSTIEIVDSEGKAYSIKVAGAADNSALTNYSFLQNYSRSFGYYFRDGKAVQFIGKQRMAAYERQELREKEKARRLRTAAKEGKDGSKDGTSGGAGLGTSRSDAGGPSLEEELSKAAASEEVDPTKPADAIDPRLPEFLKVWLSVNVMASPLDQPFPNDFIASNGRRAYEAVETMAGAKVPGLIRVRGSSPNLWRELCGQYDALLLFLKERGALLNHVPSRDLLGPDLYLKAREHEAEQEAAARGVKPSASALREAAALWEAEYEALSTRAWTTLLLQAIRVFVLARITPKAFGALPGVLLPPPKKTDKPKPKDGIDPELARSNVYTVAEGLVLKWASYHVNATTPSTALPKRITDLDSSWADGSILCHVLHSHRRSLVDGEPSSPAAKGLLAGYVQVTEMANLKNPKVRHDNYTRAVAAMQHLRVGLDVGEGLLLEAQPAITLLLALHLYMFLPQLVPRTTVDFGSTLGATTSKSIELRNPAPRAVKYVAMLEGSGDFRIPQGEVTVPAKGKADFVVELTPRFSAPVEARLSLYAERAGSVQASHMVFAVRSRVDARLPLQSKELETECYEPASCDFDVVNPFKTAATFSVSLNQQCLENLAGPFPRAAAAAKGKKKEKEDLRSEEEKLVHEALTLPFSVKASTLFLEPGASAKLSLTIIPFVPGVYKCEVVLLSPDAGELAYDCTAKVGLPKPNEKFSVKIVNGNDGSSLQRLIRLPSKNLALEAATNALLDRFPNTMKTKCRIAAQQLSRPAPPEAAEGAAEGAEAVVAYTVETDSPFYTTRGVVGMDLGGKKGAAAGLKSATFEELTPETNPNEPNSLVFNFNPRLPGAYPCRILVLGKGLAALDLRHFNVEFTVTAPPVETALEFRAPARVPITQQIPLVNRGNEEWTLKAAVAGSKAFSGPASIVVPPGAVKCSYPLQFKANWMGPPEQGTLSLKNQKTGAEFK